MRVNTHGTAAALIARVCEPFDKIELTNTAFTGRRCGFAKNDRVISAKLVIGRISEVTPEHKMHYNGDRDRILLFDYNTLMWAEYSLDRLLPNCNFRRYPAALQSHPLLSKGAYLTPILAVTSAILDAHHRISTGASDRASVKCGTDNPLGRALWTCLRAKINAIWQLFGPDNAHSVPSELRALVYAWFLRTKW